MVTHDVGKLARDQLKLVFDEVADVDYIQANGKLMTEKIQQLYAAWKDVACTKWQILGLSQYRKTLLLDCDLIVLKDLSSLFELKAPAATFSIPQAFPFVIDRKTDQPQKTAIKNMYVRDGKLPRHGDRIEGREVECALQERSFGPIGTTILLKPNTDELKELKELLADDKWCDRHQCYSMVDEQAIAAYQSRVRQRDWTHIGIDWNFVAGRTPEFGYRWLDDERDAKVIHYVGTDKPWNTPRGKWADQAIWWQTAEDLVESNSSIDERMLGLSTSKQASAPKRQKRS